MSKHSFGLLAILVAVSVQAAPTEINYQGQLLDSAGNSLATGDYELRFSIYNGSGSGAARLWGPQVFNGGGGVGLGPKVPVVGGYFNVVLGPVDTSGTPLSTAFSNPNCFLEITVGNNAPVLPRQKILSAPFALKAAALEGFLPDGNLQGTYSGPLILSSSENRLTGSFTGSGSGLTALNAGQLLAGIVADERLSANVARRNQLNDFVGSQRFLGNIGIGIGSATALHPLSVGAQETLVVNSPRGGFFNAGNSFLAMRNTVNDIETVIGSDTATGVIATMTDHPLVFRAGNNSGAGNTEYLRIARGGNVGIGVASPLEKLELALDGRIKTQSIPPQASGDGLSFSPLQTYVGGGKIQLEGGTRFTLVPGLPPTITGVRYKDPSITFARSGRESSPAQITYALGDFNHNQIVVTNADLVVRDYLYCPGLSGGSGTPLYIDEFKMVVRQTSSRRYKENIRTFQDDFSKVLKVEPKVYTRKEAPEKTEVGYIAEEMDAAGMEALTVYDTAGRPDAIDYAKIVIYSNEVLKEHQKKLEDQAEEIAELRKQLQELRAELRGSRRLR